MTMMELEESGSNLFYDLMDNEMSYDEIEELLYDSFA